MHKVLYLTLVMCNDGFGGINSMYHSQDQGPDVHGSIILDLNEKHCVDSGSFVLPMSMEIE